MGQICSLLAASSSSTTRTLSIEKATAGSLTYSRDQQIYRVGDRTVALLGEIGMLESAPISLVPLDEDTAVQLTEILRAGVVLIRSAPPVPLPRLLYAAVPSIPRNPIGARSGRGYSVLPLTVNEVSRPQLKTLQAVVTLGRFKYFPTLGDIKAAYTTLGDMKRNPPPEA
jgi:hypothetical protein